MKKTLLLFLIAILAIPASAFARGPFPSRLYDFRATVDGKTYHEGEVVVVPNDESVMFEVRLEATRTRSAGRVTTSSIWGGKVHFTFVDENGEIAYHEIDRTNVRGEARVRIYPVHFNAKISNRGTYQLFLEYHGDEERRGSLTFLPCSLGPITVVLE